MSDTTITPEERAERMQKALVRAQAFIKLHGHENTMCVTSEELFLFQAALTCAQTEIEHWGKLYLMMTKDEQQLKARAEQAEAENARLTKALETQRNLTASAHATAQAAWGGEIPSPFPGHKPPSEDAMVERFNHLNCPLCGGSGHIDDCDQTSAEAMARLTKERKWLLSLPVFLGICPNDVDKRTSCLSQCKSCWAEAARRAVADAGSEVEK